MKIPADLVERASRALHERGIKPLTAQQSAIVRLIGPIDQRALAR